MGGNISGGGLVSTLTRHAHPGNLRTTRRPIGEGKMMEDNGARFCPQCGEKDVVTRDIEPHRIGEVYCPHCGIHAVVVWQERELVGTAVTHDPDSDSESW
jgi:predicted RNA-binding Zn-ribbon protein involved in translation (DUF1610 family)